MKCKLQHLVSLLVIGIFIFLAFASFGPDASTNTSVAIKDCEEQPPIGGQLNIQVHLKVEEGDGKLTGVKAFGRLFIVHQKVDDNDACTYTSSSQVIDFETDFGGDYTYIGTPYTHDNSQDLFRVEIIVEAGLVDEIHGPYKYVAVYFYDIPTFNFTKTLSGILIGE